nr:hypothetical protein [Tanacetum cinerariifolium]
MSSECNNIKLAIQNDKFEIVSDKMADENVPAPTRSDDQILPFAAWRSTSPLHLAKEDLRLGNLKFVPKEMVTKHDQKVVAKKEGKKKAVSAKQPKSKPAVKKSSKPAPALKPKATKERPSKASAAKTPKLKPTKEKSTKTTLPQPTGKGTASEKTDSGGEIEILHIDEEQGKDVDDQVNLDEKTDELDQG